MTITKLNRFCFKCGKEMEITGKIEHFCSDLCRQDHGRENSARLNNNRYRDKKIAEKL